VSRRVAWVQRACVILLGVAPELLLGRHADVGGLRAALGATLEMLRTVRHLAGASLLGAPAPLGLGARSEVGNRRIQYVQHCLALERTARDHAFLAKPPE
jgi:hypothetical protein